MEWNSHDNCVVYSCSVYYSLTDKAQFPLRLYHSVFSSYFIIIYEEHHLWSYVMSLHVYNLDLAVT